MTISNDLKEALAWPEEVWFAECPYCKETVTLGTDASFGKGDLDTCNDCGKDFTLPLQED